MFLSTTKITWDDPPSRSAIEFWLLGTTPDLCYGVNKDEEKIFHFRRNSTNLLPQESVNLPFYNYGNTPDPPK